MAIIKEEIFAPKGMKIGHLPTPILEELMDHIWAEKFHSFCSGPAISHEEWLQVFSKDKEKYDKKIEEYQSEQRESFAKSLLDKDINDYINLYLPSSWEYEDTCLTIALKYQDYTLAQNLLLFGADPNKPSSNFNGRRPLMLSNDLLTAYKLLKMGADINLVTLSPDLKADPCGPYQQRTVLQELIHSNDWMKEKIKSDSELRKWKNFCSPQLAAIAYFLQTEYKFGYGIMMEKYPSCITGERISGWNFWNNMIKLATIAKNEIRKQEVQMEIYDKPLFDYHEVIQKLRMEIVRLQKELSERDHRDSITKGLKTDSDPQPILTQQLAERSALPTLAQVREEGKEKKEAIEKDELKKVAIS